MNPMDRHEEEIDRVLGALGRAQPGAGLEERVLARLAQPAETAKRRTRWSLPLLAIACLAGLAMFFALRTPRVQKTTAVAFTHSMPQENGSKVLPVAASQTLQPAPMRVLRVATVVSAIEPHPDRGLADLPSRLAPTAPLTGQEQQLAQMARAPDRQQLAILNPVQREREQEQSAAEFKQFFPPPTPEEIYLATHIPN